MRSVKNKYKEFQCKPWKDVQGFSLPISKNHHYAYAKDIAPYWCSQPITNPNREIKADSFPSRHETSLTVDFNSGIFFQAYCTFLKMHANLGHFQPIPSLSLSLSVT